MESHLASIALTGCEHLDPRGISSAADIQTMTENGQCFTATSGQASAVYVVQVVNGVAWINACQGQGAIKWQNLLLPVIEQQASGCKAVGFQTKRRGLVKAAQRHGYQITGWILKKNLPQ